MRSRRNRPLYANFEVTFLWRAREKLPGKVVFDFLAIADLFYVRLLGVPVGTGLAIAAQSLPLAEVAIGKFAWNFEQGPHLGAKPSWGLGVLTWFHYTVTGTWVRVAIPVP